MYRFLCKFLPTRIANIVIALWYLFLLALIFMFYRVGDIGFRYLQV
jgi:hypothetical protein